MTRIQGVITELIDDLDGSPAARTVRFGYAGRQFEIELSEEHADELDRLLDPYLERARLTGRVPTRTQRAQSVRRSPEELRAIRQWAREQGLDVSDKGWIPYAIVAKYEAAQAGE